MPLRVAVLALEGVMPFDLGTPTQILASARDATRGNLYDVRVCTPDGASIRTSAGYHLLPEHGLEAFDDADTVIVSGINAGPPMVDGTLDAKVADALRRHAGQGRRLVSVCTGAFVLAAAGLLDGRRATTHWRQADRFRGLYPRVRLDPHVLFVDDGDILTSAGVGAGIDLCLHLVRRDHGAEVANRAARKCVVPAWRDGGQAQFIERPLPPLAGSTTEPTRAWMLSHLGEPMHLAALARRAGMSVRTFTRRFRAETGVSPGAWVARQRIERARHLLEETDLPVDRVARDAGFGTPASLRQHLRAELGVAPLTYRRTFRGTG
ncbi:MAG TPA: helix-turn-helix domain-containing protein [Actinopolymorphaceae bacterium]|nr:helix-turn-helix domain-containing protein [Actinopolymorphaceae bacterium]